MRKESRDPFLIELDFLFAKSAEPLFIKRKSRISGNFIRCC